MTLGETEAAAIAAQVARVAGRLWERGWAEGNAGNISVRLPAKAAPEPAPEGPPAAVLEEPLGAIRGHTFLTTGTGTRMRDVADGSGVGRVRVDDDGRGYRVIGAGADAVAPTSEFPTHLLVHDHLVAEGRPQTTVVHTHPTELIALTHLPEGADEAGLNRLLWSMHPEVLVFVPGGAGIVPYTLPGSFDLARATVAALAGRSVALWAMHGAVAVARDPESAFDLIDILTKAARIYLAARATGREPRGLGDADLDALRDAFPGRGI